MENKNVKCDTYGCNEKAYKMIVIDENVLGLDYLCEVTYLCKDCLEHMKKNNPNNILKIIPKKDW